MFQFIKSTPVGGDCTCGYNIILDKVYTVREFIETVLKGKTKEWGCIGIYKQNSIFGEPSCKYNSGGLTTDNLPTEILDKTIKEVSVSGGWSRMDYLIKL